MGKNYFSGSTVSSQNGRDDMVAIQPSPPTSSLTLSNTTYTTTKKPSTKTH